MIDDTYGQSPVNRYNRAYTSTTHGQLTPDHQRASGVTPDLVRLSVGIEDPADILADLERAIERAEASS